MDISIVTYNVHAWIDIHKDNSQESICNVINKLNCDIAGLQEVSFTGRKNRALIERETGMKSTFGPTITDKESKFGNIILSRHGFRNIRKHDITYKNREARGVLDVDIEIKGKIIRILTTHFGLSLKERKEQAKALLKIISSEQTRYNLSVLMGDFNEWFFMNKPLRKLIASFGSIPKKKTFPSRLPMLALDRIFIKPVENLNRLYTMKNNITNKASDHLPLIAQVEL